MSRRKFIKAAAGVAVGATVGASLARAAGKRQPNILFVFTDQHRRHALGFMGEDPVLTPHIDRFASEGLVFKNAVSNRPLCSPYRAMLMTGRYPASNGVAGNCNSVWPQNYLRESERCISDVLHDAGYDCGYIGKWHLDHPDGPRSGHWSQGNWDGYTPPGPKRHHFNFWYAYGCMFDYMKPHFWVGNAPKNKKTVVNEWEPTHEANVAIDYIRNREGKQRDPHKPFALFLSTHPPHGPVYPVPEKYLRLYQDTPVKSLLNRPNLGVTGAGKPAAKGKKAIKKAEHMVRGYFAAVTGVDEQFGRILKCLKSEGLEQDTIVVFTADHGEMLGSHGLFGKGALYEESIGIPFIIRWTGKIRTGVEDMPLSVPDLMPTLLGLAGLRHMTPKAVEGTDYSKVMLGTSTRKTDAALLFHGKSAGGVRTRRHMLEFWKEKDGAESYRLFDLRKDPYQLKNVADNHPVLVKTLRAEARKLARRFSADT